jgi:hypothetical protein
METDVMSSIDPVVAIVGFLIWLVMFIGLIWAHVRIVQKAGYSGWNILWMFVPIANIVMFLIFAFGRWPIEDKVARLESKVF